MTEQTPTVLDLEIAANDIQLTASPLNAASHLDKKIGEFRDRFTFESRYVGSKDAEQAYGDDVKREFDNALADSLLTWKAQAAAVGSELETRIETSRQAPTTKDPLLDVNRQLLALARWEGRTLRQAVDAYVATADDADSTFVRLMETDTDFLRLTPGDDDVEAIMRLRTAIEARRSSREDKTARAALERLKGLKTASFAALISYAERGELRVATAGDKSIRLTTASDRLGR